MLASFVCILFGLRRAITCPCDVFQWVWYTSLNRKSITTDDDDERSESFQAANLSP